ncbi:MAG: EFR1 family ferrodoxin [Prevotella sp.]|nr:EFR1 family ferrodoxin [Prevotella sp.]
MIFYFSATGNTRWAASSITTLLEETLTDMSSCQEDDRHFVLKKGESLGFCFPVHGWNVPKIVKEFVENLNISWASDERPYTWVLLTAGDTTGETIDIFSTLLGKIGLKLDAACTLVMPESYVGLPMMDVDTRQKETEKIESAKTVLKKFVHDIANRNKDTSHIIRGKWPHINTRVLGRYFHKHLITDKPFHVDKEKCTRCGLCSHKCPVKNISNTADSLPQWLHNGKCMTCFACYHYCPHKAIEFGKRTSKKGQYYCKAELIQDL